MMALVRGCVTFQLLAGKVPLLGPLVRGHEAPVRQDLGLQRRRGRAVLQQWVNQIKRDTFAGQHS